MKILKIAAALSFVLFLSFYPAKAQAPSASVQEAGKQQGAAEANISTLEERLGQYGESLHWGRDPFARLSFVEEGSSGASGLELVGIIWDKEVPVAIIGDEIVKEGDTLGRFEVIEINKDSVILNDGARDYRLQITR